MADQQESRLIALVLASIFAPPFGIKKSCRGYSEVRRVYMIQLTRMETFTTKSYEAKIERLRSEIVELLEDVRAFRAVSFLYSEKIGDSMKNIEKAERKVVDAKMKLLEIAIEYHDYVKSSNLTVEIATRPVVVCY